MKLHTNLTATEVDAALHAAKRKRLIAWDVDFNVFTPGRSLTHAHGYEIHLGTNYQDSLPAGYTDQNGARLRVRRLSGTTQGTARYAATWHEWGWFMAEVFAADPGARWGQDPARSARPEYAWGYASEADFHRKTDGQFRLHYQQAPLVYSSGGNLVIPTS